MGVRACLPSAVLGAVNVCLLPACVVCGVRAVRCRRRAHLMSSTATRLAGAGACAAAAAAIRASDERMARPSGRRVSVLSVRTYPSVVVDRRNACDASSHEPFNHQYSVIQVRP